MTVDPGRARSTGRGLDEVRRQRRYPRLDLARPTRHLPGSARRRGRRRMVTASASTSAHAVTPALLSAHYRLGQHRAAGESRVAVYPPDDPGGFGPALQVVTDRRRNADGFGHRAAAPARRGLHGDHEPGLPRAPRRRRRTARRRPARRPTTAGSTRPGSTFSLSPSVDRKALHEARTAAAGVLADARQVAADSTAMIGHPQRPGRRRRNRRERSLPGR